MKKKTTNILIALLMLLLCFGLVACDRDGTDPGTPDDNGGPPEVTYFNVTFDSDGGTSLSNYNKKVEYGQTISKPVNSLGAEVIPIKTGYTFAGWSLNGGALYDFANYTITANTNIKALWTAKSYTHEVYLFDENLKANIEGIGDSSARDYYGTDVKIADGEGNDLAIEGSDPPRYAFSTSYQAANASSRQSVVSPITTKTGDFFVFWYYYDDTDNDGEEDDKVRLTDVRDATDVGVSTLSTAYNIDSALIIYAMWHSCLDNVTVTFDSDGGTAVAPTTKKEFDTLAKPVSPTKVGYEFGYWYYTEEIDGNTKEYSFNFDDPSTADDDTAADLLGKDVTLKAKWIKKYEIGAANVSDLALALSDTENLNAKIYIIEDITIDGWSAKCDKSAPFTGSIDGGTYKPDGTLDTTVSSHQIILNNIAPGQYNSLLICNNGTIKNLRVSFELFSLRDEDGDFDLLGEESTVYAAAVAAFNEENAVINSVEVTICGTIKTARDIIFGGIVASNNGGEIYDCSVSTPSPITVEATDSTAYVGGIAGINGENGGFAQRCSFFGTLQVTANKGYAGGFFGKTTSGTSKMNVIEDSAITVNGAQKAIAGGFAGFLYAGSCNQLYIKTGVTVEATSSSENGVTMAGGVAGENWGNILNCQIDNVTVSATATGIGATNCAGGITGYNFTDGGELRGSVKSSMLLDGTVNGSAYAEGAKAYVGGITGRNYLGIIANVYSSVSVTATVAAQLENTVGYSVGGSQSASYANVFYNNQKSLSKNDVIYAKDSLGVPNFSVFESDKIEGKIQDTAGVEPFNNIRNSSWLTSSLSLEAAVWDMPTVNDKLPTLKFLAD